ncbi:hypothetical protein RND81_06G229800 [Saponaria officinalis]|uniref:SHSP domain-containing protein n=1 Tax=Saponaria officinalis TaxID=3572 RepID=A0AAW1KEG9_SAPOF
MMMTPMTSFFRLVGPTLAPPILTAIKPRQMEGPSEIETEPTPQRSLLPLAKFTPKSTLLESVRASRVKESPYKVQGPELPMSVWEPEGGGYVKVRVDMPGANAIEMETEAHENVIKFKGIEEKIGMHGIGGENEYRTYEGSLELDPDRFAGLDYEYELCNGVLDLHIRCKTPAQGDYLGVTLKANPIEARNDITIESAINPLVVSGKDRYSLHGFSRNDRAFIYAIDMPGIGELDFMNVEVYQDNVNFKAKDKSTAADYGERSDHKKRKYEGHFKVNLKELDTKKIQYEISHGVFWIMVPRRTKTNKEIVKLFHGNTSENLYDREHFH